MREYMITELKYSSSLKMNSDTPTTAEKNAYLQIFYSRGNRCMYSTSAKY